MRVDNHNESGYVLAVTALSALAFMLVVGFAVDLGAWYLNVSRLQRAADAASLAGAVALPDTDQASQNVTDSLRNNGYVDGADSITVTTTVSSDRLVTEVKDNNVKTYFTSMFLPHLVVSRESTAIRANAAPALGSPFNVMGTGDLNIPGLPAKQYYWLAINGACDPKEDGDYFFAFHDRSKGPFTGAFVDHQAVLGPNAQHHCTGTPLPGQIDNPDFEPSGYSYFVDIPKPATVKDVDIKVYDPAFYDITPGGQPSNDKSMFLSADGWSYPSYKFTLFKTNGTPDDPSDDTKISHIGALANDDQTVMFKKWFTLFTVPYSSIPADGTQYRVQVEGYTGGLDFMAVRAQSGANSFSLGAFPGGAIAACDSRTDVHCPRVYGRKAVSVYNDLVGPSGGNADFYFAEIDTAYIGKTIDLNLWDPGEGVQKLQVLGPDGTPLKFDWAADTTYSGTNVDFIDSSGSGPPAGPNLSNDYKFNDRLITIRLTLPSDYGDMVSAAGGSKWLKIRYTIGTTSSDRTTWGVTVSSSPSAPPRLTRK